MTLASEPCEHFFSGEPIEKPSQILATEKYSYLKMNPDAQWLWTCEKCGFQKIGQF
jgi:hypothetical protein